MVFLDGITLGWLLILSGALLLLVEVSQPGFFCHGTCHRDDISRHFIFTGSGCLQFRLGVVIGVIIAICAAGFTVWMYGKITTNESPTTISRDSLVGMEGQVKIRVDATTISGKVLIASTEWSARSTGSEIPPGKKVKVVDSQGCTYRS